MKLVVYELDSPVVQEITIGDHAIQVDAIRPWLYKHTTPAGSLKIQIKSSVDVLLFESEEIAISAITSATGNYFHGPVRFYIDAALQANTNYKIVLVGAAGYSFNESAYVGWCNGYDMKFIANDYTPAGPLTDALMLELWGKKKVRKGNN